MDKISKLRLKFGLDKVQLTYRSLIRMSFWIVGSFLALAFLISLISPAKSISRFTTLASSDYRSAEKELVEYLQENPEAKDYWRLLVGLRSEVKQVIKFQNQSDVLDLQGGTRSFNLEPFLDAPSFMNFLKTAKSPSPEALKARYLFLVSGGKNSSLIFKVHPDPEERAELAVVSFGRIPFKDTLKLADDLIESGHESEELRKLALSCLAQLGMTEELQSRLQSAEWQKYAENRTLYKFHFDEKNYGKMFYYLTQSQYDLYTWKVILVCSVAGLGWMIFLIHLGGGWRWPKMDLVKVLCAVGLGMLSAIFCLFVVVLQDNWIGHDTREHTLIYNLAYCILGIGLREEVCKMLLFLPMLYWLRKEKSYCRILIFSSLVGLGFAIEENYGYLSRAEGDPGALMARFMTANFLHMLMTGYICYYLTLAIQYKGRHWDHFTSAFIKVVLVHGVYDFLLIDSNMVEEGMDFFAMMLYIWIAMHYLKLMLDTSPPTHRYVSLTRVFTIVLSVTFGLSLLVVSLDIGVALALKASLMAIIGNVMFAYMFYYQMNDNIR
ncbi:MAG: PrsW family intramembrane metalloprotease [Lentisphaeraceae bacterium]|nr:PrsW family intramembrane metalloprotease [Lentisphaeraceae bacterium]